MASSILIKRWISFWWVFSLNVFTVQGLIGRSNGSDWVKEGPTADISRTNKSAGVHDRSNVMLTSVKEQSALWSGRTRGSWDEIVGIRTVWLLYFEGHVSKWEGGRERAGVVSSGKGFWSSGLGFFSSVLGFFFLVRFLVCF